MTTYQKVLAGLVVLIWVIAAINPPDREGWLLENIVILVFVPIVILTGRYFQLSSVSYTLIALFLVIHIVGAHWTYDKVPFGYQIGHWLGTERNMYDRFAHFCFGLLLAYPIREVFLRLTGARGVWGFYFPFDVVLSLSALYEIFEWVAALLIDPVHVVDFVGSQGDFWDTQKDMVSAAVGALIAIVAVFLMNLFLNKELWAEMRESLRIKREKPLGEDGLWEMLGK